MRTSSNVCFNFLAIFFYFSTLYEVICYKFCQAGSGSTFTKLLDPDPH